MNLPQIFDLNEWLITIGLFLLIILMLLLPKRFPHTITILILMFCMVTPIILDTMIATKPFDFYNFNDTSKFEVFDFLLWFFYAPFSYFFYMVLINGTYKVLTYSFTSWCLRCQQLGLNFLQLKHIFLLLMDGIYFIVFRYTLQFKVHIQHSTYG